MTAEFPFSFIELPPERSQTKPRRSGLTMFADFGIPLAYQRDVLALAGRYVDFAKVATGTSRLYERAYLERKLAAYKEAEIRPFMGGQFQEYVFATQGRRALEPLLREAKRLGFDAVEVSDNCVPLTDAERRDQIRLAIDCGLAVFGEVGSKDERSDAATLLRQAEVCFEAGAELVLVEAAELVEDGRPKRELLDALVRGLDLARVMEAFAKKHGLTIRLVPFRSGAEGSAAILGGHVTLAETGVGTSAWHSAREGGLKILATLTPGGLEPFGYPDVPTLEEFGADYLVRTEYGYAVRGDTPAEIVAKLSDAFRQAIEDPEVHARLTEIDLTPEWTPPDEYAEMLRSITQDAEELKVYLKEE